MIYTTSIYTASKKILIWLLLSALCFMLSTSHAEVSQNDFAIIPEATDPNIGNTVNQIGAEGGKVIDNYKNAAYGEKNPDGTRKGTNMSLGDQLASGVMTRDTLLDYVTYIVRFLLQLGLLLGAVVMIYLGYKKITEFRDFKPMGLKYVIMGIAILSFAYVIIRTLVSMFIS